MLKSEQMRDCNLANIFEKDAPIFNKSSSCYGEVIFDGTIQIL